MKKLFVIDSLGYLFRSYYAIRNLSKKTGESTNALYGFIRAVLKIIKEFEPTHLVAVFDGPDNSKRRREIYPEYKKNRVNPPEDLPHQLQWAYEFCKLANIPCLRLEHVEADDAMAAIAKWAAKQDSEVFLCTSDKDLYQLVSDKIFVLNTHKNNLVLDAEKVKENFGVWPSQVHDYLSIIGDASDNIPGIKSFGPKTAQGLLDKAQNLENLIQSPEKYLNEKKLKIFTDQLEQLKMSYKLVQLDPDVNTPETQDFYKLNPLPQDPLILFYEDMNFNSLIREFKVDDSHSQLTLPEFEVKTQIIQDLDQLKSLILDLEKQTEICIDTETTGLNQMEDKIVGIGIGYSLEKVYYIPLNGRLEQNDVIRLVKPLLENPQIGFYGHNIKYDLHLFKNHDIEINNVCGDTMLLSYLLNPHLRQHSLDDLSLNCFNFKKIATKDLIGSGKDQKCMSDLPVDQVGNYCGEDIFITIKLKNLLEKQVVENGLEKVYKDIEVPLISILFNMERLGIYIESQMLLGLKTQLNANLEVLEKDTYELAGEDFNLKSPKQLSEILYSKLGIKPSKKTKTGFSTNAEALEIIQDAHPIVTKILEFRTLEKLRSTYVESLVHDVNPHTRRVHCSFNQTITATGRLSCQNPNLQNIPVKTDEGKKIREVFKPQKEGYSFLAADYSQIELRLLAHLSEDPVLLDTFNQHQDVHAQTAAKIFNLPLDQVTKKERYLAKAVNFGILYGQQSFGLSKQLKISVKEAKEFIETYFEKYQKVKEYLALTKEMAKEKGFAITLFGRKRPIPEIMSKNKMLQQAAERLAVNTPFQGSNADIIKMAMIEIKKRFKETSIDAKMLLQIHDELLFEVKDSDIVQTQKIVKGAMEEVIKLKVPLIVDIKIGKNWKEC